MNRLKIAAVGTGSAVLLAVGALSAAPAMAATPAPAKAHASVTVDTVKNTATVKTAKRGTFTIAWHTVSKHRELVTVKNAKGEVVRVRLVGEKAIAHAEKAADAGHYRAVLKLWHGHHKHHHNKAAKAS